MNELIDLLAKQENIPEEGLQELVIKGWESCKGEHQLLEPLNDSVMQSLLSKC